MMKSMKGNDLIVVHGFTFRQHSPLNSRIWRCSRRDSKTKCKAKLLLNEDNSITSLDNQHSHPKPNILMTASGEYIRLW